MRRKKKVIKQDDIGYRGVITFDELVEDILKQKLDGRYIGEKEFGKLWEKFCNELVLAVKDPKVITINLFNEIKFYLTEIEAEKLEKEAVDKNKKKIFTTKKRLIKNLYKTEEIENNKPKLFLTLNPAEKQNFIDLEDYNEKD